MASRIDSLAAAKVMCAAGLEPLVNYPGAREKWSCRCVKCGRLVSPNYDSVRRGASSGCKWCGREGASAKYRANGKDMAVALAAERYLEPLEPYSGMTTPWRCRCLRCGVEVFVRAHDLKVSGGCAACGHAEGGAKNRHPERVVVGLLRDAGFEPLEPYPGVMTPWNCRCLTCGKSTTKTLNDIKNRVLGCRWCLRLIVDPDSAVKIMRNAGLEPLTGYPGSSKPWSCRCLHCRTIVSPYYCSVVSGQGGCRWCAKHGFNASEDAIVYLIENPAYGAVKIGVADTKGSRLKKHGKHGWQILVTVCVLGERALAIEKVILSWWRTDLGLLPFLSKSEMPQFGWTETVDADAISIPATIERIRTLAIGETSLINT